MKYVFAGDRQISLNILKWMINKGYSPSALMVSSGENESHADELIKVSKLSKDKIFIGKSFMDMSSIETLKLLDVDYFIGIHFPYIISSDLLNIPKIGFLNLHPAYLPYNKGWHTPSWAILEGTPYGATLHFMSEDLDGGDIIHQKILNINPNDTANTLYKRVLELEQEVFFESFESLITLMPKKSPQNYLGTTHGKKDLEKIQSLNHEEVILLKKLRALTTNKLEEAAYFDKDGKRYYVNVKIIQSK